MREILFKGKTIANESKWVEGFYNHIPCGRFLCDEHCIQTIAEDGRIGQLYDVYESTVGQFTGLTDKNGKKIFEGDIIRVGGDTYACYWDNGNVEFIVSNPRESFGLAYAAYPCMEVIGNIHDNPKLLED